MSEVKSFRSVDMAPAEAMSTAALYLEREWGANRRLGYAGRVERGDGRLLFVFQCLAGDGSRWLIWADKYGGCGTFDFVTEQETALTLDVEVS